MGSEIQPCVTTCMVDEYSNPAAPCEDQELSHALRYTQQTICELLKPEVAGLKAFRQENPTLASFPFALVFFPFNIFDSKWLGIYVDLYPVGVLFYASWQSSRLPL